MCGIVEYVGSRAATPIIVAGLRRLEYRGYDSAGLAVLQGRRIAVRRDVGKLSALEELLAREPAHGQIGIGHTRWATHGRPCQRNAHPHTDCRGEIVVIHNSIVENFLPLRQELQAQGHRFRSDTDTEVIVHLVEEEMKDGSSLLIAVRRAMARLKGAHGLLLMSSREPDKLAAAATAQDIAGSVLNVGSGREVSINELADTIEEVVGRPAHRLYSHTESGGVSRLVADIGLARKKLGFAPKVDLRRGIRLLLAEDKQFAPRPSPVLREVLTRY